MKDYKIVIQVFDISGVYSANNDEEAMQIAQEQCDDIYVRLKGKCSVLVKSVKEVEK